MMTSLILDLIGSLLASASTDSPQIAGIKTSIEYSAGKTDVAGVKISDISLVRVEHLNVDLSTHHHSSATGAKAEPATKVTVASKDGATQEVTLDQSQNKALTISDVLPYQLRTRYVFHKSSIGAYEVSLGHDAMFHIAEHIPPSSERYIKEIRLFGSRRSPFLLVRDSKKKLTLSGKNVTIVLSQKDENSIFDHTFQLKALPLDRAISIFADRDEPVVTICKEAFGSAMLLRCTHETHPTEIHIIAFPKK